MKITSYLQNLSVRTVRTLLMLGLVLWSTTSCLDDDGYSLDKFWVDYGVIDGTPGSYTIVTDNGKRLFPSASAIPGFQVKDSMRVILNYTILGDGAANSSIHHYVRINDMRKVLKKNIVELTAENTDSIGNDGLRILQVWTTPAYDLLNVEFAYQGSPYYTHYINLVTDATQPSDSEGNTMIQLRHNKNGDPYTSPLLTGVASFDLRSLRKEGANSVAFRLQAKALPGEEEYSQTGTYTYSWDN